MDRSGGDVLYVEAMPIHKDDKVTLTGRTGSITAPLEVTDTIMPGVVSLPHGWGHDRDGVRLATARAHPGVSANDVTDAGLVDALSGNAAVNGVPVEVTPVTEGRSALRARTDGLWSPLPPGEG